MSASLSMGDIEALALLARVSEDLYSVQLNAGLTPSKATKDHIETLTAVVSRLKAATSTT